MNSRCMIDMEKHYNHRGPKCYYSAHDTFHNNVTTQSIDVRVVWAAGRQGFSIPRKKKFASKLEPSMSQLLESCCKRGPMKYLTAQKRNGSKTTRCVRTCFKSMLQAPPKLCIFLIFDPGGEITKTWTKVNPSGPLFDRRLNTEDKRLPNYVSVVVPFVLSFRNSFKTATEVCKPRGSANGHPRASSGVEESMRTTLRKYLMRPTKIFDASDKTYDAFDKNIWCVRQKYMMRSTKTFDVFDKNIWCRRQKYMMPPTKISDASDKNNWRVRQKRWQHARHKYMSLPTKRFGSSDNTVDKKVDTNNWKSNEY